MLLESLMIIFVTFEHDLYKKGSIYNQINASVQYIFILVLHILYKMSQYFTAYYL